MAVDILNEQSAVKFTKRMDMLIRAVVKRTLEHEGLKPIGVSVLITDDENIQKLNLSYRGKDKPTDVLSFPLCEGGRYDGELGDIVISLERAAAQAESYGHSLERELAFLTAHSMLHLLGYDHEEDETQMFEKQDEILADLNITR